MREKFVSQQFLLVEVCTYVLCTHVVPGPSLRLPRGAVPRLSLMFFQKSIIITNNEYRQTVAQTNNFKAVQSTDEL